jgi:hypothetical protein
MFDYVSFSQNLDELDCQLSAGTGEAEAVVQSFDISTGSPTCESFATQLEAQTWFDLNAFADFELRTELDPDNTDVACNHEGSPLRVIPEETEAGSDTNTTEPEPPPCTNENEGQWATRNWQQQKETLTYNGWRGRDYWESFDTSFEGWTYEAYRCSVRSVDGQKILIGFGPGWQSVTTVWSPFGPEFIPLGEDYGYPAQQQLDALGTCSPGDFFTYSHLYLTGQDFANRDWYHASYRCLYVSADSSESVLRMTHAIFPDARYPEAYARDRYFIVEYAN